MAIEISPEEREYMIAFGLQVQKVRSDLGFSRREVAIGVGMPIENLWRIERGRMRCSILKMVKIAQFLNVSVATLVRINTSSMQLGKNHSCKKQKIV